MTLILEFCGSYSKPLSKVISQRTQRTGRIRDPQKCGGKEFEHHMMGGKWDFPLWRILAGYHLLTEEKQMHRNHYYTKRSTEMLLNFISSG